METVIDLEVLTVVSTNIAIETVSAFMLTKFYVSKSPFSQIQPQ